MSRSLSQSHTLTLSLIHLSLTKTLYFLVQEHSIDNNTIQIKTHCLLNMENKTKSIQYAPLLYHCHRLFQFLLPNLVRMLYPLMLLSFSLVLVLIFLILTLWLLFERVNTLVLLILCLILSIILICHLHIVLLFLLWTHTQFSSLCSKPFLSHGGEMSCKRKWWL